MPPPTCSSPEPRQDPQRAPRQAELKAEPLVPAPAAPSLPSTARTRCSREPFQSGTPRILAWQSHPTRPLITNPHESSHFPRAGCGRGPLGCGTHLVERLYHLHKDPLLRGGPHNWPSRLPSGRVSGCGAAHWRISTGGGGGIPERWTSPTRACALRGWGCCGKGRPRCLTRGLSIYVLRVLQSGGKRWKQLAGSWVVFLHDKDVLPTVLGFGLEKLNKCSLPSACIWVEGEFLM